MPGVAKRQRSARRPRRHPFREKPRRPENPDDEMQEYSPADLKRLFGLPPALIRKLGQAGFITQAGKKGSKYAFQDLLVLRVAGALKAAKLSSPKIMAALEQIRSVLPSDRLPAIALAASGKDIAVREGSREWEASGQYALPLATNLGAGLVSELRRQPDVPVAALAHEHYQRGHMLEDTDVVAARAAYLAALGLQEDHLEARINLGRLMHLDGQLKEAELLYRQAKTSSALLSFNLAILLEDLEREEEAVAAYRDALAQDPLLHDAHFNLSRLHEKANRPREALRHLLAYRRHIARYGE
ncbi:MAG TPA: tetratricopeptide repeat protein [Steroidobacteraceae bacterium]|nr:tetratricopeptide repeat protein [Steroidobacteraceae bacterium]